MIKFIVLWFTILEGLQENAIPSRCGQVEDPRTGEYSQYFIINGPNEDGAFISRFKSDNSLSAVYFKNRYECEFHLGEYSNLILEEKYKNE